MIITHEADARAWIAGLPEWSDQAGQQLERLGELLREENAHQNLVAAASLDTLWLRHIADSAQLLPHVPRETSSPWLDLGTGAGFPGLVVAILRPDTAVHLVESRARRIEWLIRAANTLGLGNVTIHGSRLELVPTFPVRVISARAFAPLAKLIELSARFSTADTRWLLPKGRSAAHELEQLRGWKHLFHVEQSLTDPDAGVIVGSLIGPHRSGKKGSKP
ncbi:MAG: 16S rRNA (guanine(527)-N(7))-methyltransferase RsmG [Sphingomonadales bacterium]|nr:16S rRNA (guanine(527)-N(7))-methyltransferase RsmG [Sphingomonadales bacterium]